MSESTIQTMYLIGGIAGFIIWFFLTRWVHRVEAKVDRLNAQALLLAEIALKQGVDEERIKNILKSNMIEGYKETKPQHHPTDPYALPIKPELVKDDR